MRNVRTAMTVGMLIFGLAACGEGDQSSGLTTTSTPSESVSPLEKCTVDMFSAVKKMLDDFVNGYENFDGPLTHEVMAQYGPSSPFFLAAGTVWGYVVGIYARQGYSDALDQIVPFATKQCPNLIASELR